MRIDKKYGYALIAMYPTKKVLNLVAMLNGMTQQWYVQYSIYEMSRQRWFISVIISTCQHAWFFVNSIPYFVQHDFGKIFALAVH